MVVCQVEEARQVEGAASLTSTQRRLWGSRESDDRRRGTRARCR